MSCDYLAALDRAYEQAGSLRDLEAAFLRVVSDTYSHATWGRLINREQEPTYDELCQIAALTGLSLPPMPMEEVVKHIRQWHTVGDRPTYGLLVSQGGTISYMPNDNEEIQVQERKPVKPRKRKPDRSVRIRMDPEQAKALAVLAMRSPWCMTVSDIERQAIEDIAPRLREAANRKLKAVN
jgi:hypothetical protein